MTFNECLKHQREISGYTQKQVAELLKIAPRSYQRYELGEREPNIETLVQIANLFNISLDDLVGRNLP
jgi:transcriptional regulator with XRE-family HTH domain